MAPKDPNGIDYQRLDYPQPKCVICGRFAQRTRHGWQFSCVTDNIHRTKETP